jgi:hypothetical protein
VEVQVPAAQLIHLPIAAADAGTLVRFGNAVHHQVRWKTDPVADGCTPCIEQNIQRGLVSPDDTHLAHYPQRSFVHGLDVFVGKEF